MHVDRSQYVRYRCTAKMGICITTISPVNWNMVANIYLVDNEFVESDVNFTLVYTCSKKPQTVYNLLSHINYTVRYIAMYIRFSRYSVYT